VLVGLVLAAVGSSRLRQKRSSFVLFVVLILGASGTVGLFRPSGRFMWRVFRCGMLEPACSGIIWKVFSPRPTRLFDFGRLASLDAADITF
jgi:hypothetical protein